MKEKYIIKEELSPIQSILKKRSAYYQRMKKREYEFKSPLVKQLQNLDEISRADAYELEFFYALDHDEQLDFVKYYEDNFLRRMREYENLHCGIITTLSELVADYAKINSYLYNTENTKHYNIYQSIYSEIFKNVEEGMQIDQALALKKEKIDSLDLDELSKEEENRILNMNLAISIYQKVLQTHEDFYYDENLDCTYHIAEFIEKRNTLSRQIMTHAKRMEYFMLDFQQDKEPITFIAYSTLRNSIPQYLMKPLKNYRKDIKKYKNLIDKQIDKVAETIVLSNMDKNDEVEEEYRIIEHSILFEKN